MKKGKNAESQTLRQKAEELVRIRPLKPDFSLSEAETIKLIHELEVHHLELELQNEELIETRARALEDAEKYVELYEFAPVGYFTLSNEGEIIELNLAGSQLLGKEREQLKNKRFVFFITSDTKPVFNLFFETLFKSKVRESCELILSNDGNRPVNVHISGIADQDGESCLITAIDITKHVKADEEIRKIGKHYQAIIEKASDGFALINSEGKFKLVSPSSRRIFGYNATEEITDDPAEFTHPDDLHLVLPELDKLIKDPAYVPTVQYRFADKDGNWKWIESIFTNLLADPNVEAIVINFREITERKEAENALRESEEKFRRVVEHIGDAVIMDDVEGKIVFANERFFTLFGLHPEELSRITLEDYISPEWREELRDRHNRRIKGEEVPACFEYGGIRKNGQQVWVEVNVMPIVDEKGTIIGTQSAIRDITERKQADEGLKKSLDEMRRFHRLTVGRELTMIEMKKEVNELLRKSGQEEKYRIVG